MATEVSASERMVVRASEELQNGDVVFVGIGLPNVACNLARSLHAPDLFMIYESGAVGTVPDRLPVSIGDPTLVTGSLAIVSQIDIFQNYLQGGLIQVGFLGGAQIDRFGNLNTTVIGAYDNPKVRLPGSGGACEIALHSQKLLIMMRMSPKSFVEKVDFVTSPGHKHHSLRGMRSGYERDSMNWINKGPARVVTDLGVFDFQEGEMVLTEIFEGVTLDQVQAQCGWKVRSASSLKKLSIPKNSTVELLRSIDSEKLYL